MEKTVRLQDCKTVRPVTGSVSRHCERSEAIQKSLCTSVFSPRTSVKQKNSYTENHKEPQRTTERKKSVIQLLSYSVILLLCCAPLLAFAQDVVPQYVVSYGYDDSGNRTSRTINMRAPENTPPPQDSTENVIEDEEDIVAYIQDMENEDQIPQEVYTDALSETLITIYPNPTRGLLTVKMSNMPQHSASSLTLFDMQGKVITQQQSLAEENKLDISAQPPGTYIMRIAVGDENVSWKIVKM